MKVIQICGTNGTGKTTLVKGLLTSGNFLRMELQIDGEVKEWWYDGEVAVIGRYTRNNCCGVDAGNYSGEQLIKVIDTILAVYEPKAVVFECLMFGLSYKFKQNLFEVSKRHNRSYVVITLTAALTTLSERVIRRTGNENVNFDGVNSKMRQAINSTRLIQADGATAYIIDTEQKSKKEILDFLKVVLNG